MNQSQKSRYFQKKLMYYSKIHLQDIFKEIWYTLYTLAVVRCILGRSFAIGTHAAHPGQASRFRVSLKRQIERTGEVASELALWSNGEFYGSVGWR